MNYWKRYLKNSHSYTESAKKFKQSQHLNIERVKISTKQVGSDGIFEYFFFSNSAPFLCLKPSLLSTTHLY